MRKSKYRKVVQNANEREDEIENKEMANNNHPNDYKSDVNMSNDRKGGERERDDGS